MTAIVNEGVRARSVADEIPADKMNEACIVPTDQHRAPYLAKLWAIITPGSRHLPPFTAQVEGSRDAGHGPPRNSPSVLPVAQWIVHMPPKRGIQVRFLSGGPKTNLKSMI